MKPILILFCALFLVFIQNESKSQCCAAGNPTSTNCSVSDGGKNVFNISLSHYYSMSNSYYNGSTYESGKQFFPSVIKESYFNFSSLSLSYGLTGKLRITGDLGYFLDKSQRFTSGYTRYAQGIADAALGFVYSTYSSDDKLFDITQSARATIPIGDFKQVYDDIQLPIDLQPSSGNYKYNLGISFLKRFAESNFSLLSVNSFEMSQAIETENTVHKYGNLYNLSLIGKYQLSSFIAALVQLRGEIREKALTGTKSQNNQYSYINASGGTLMFLSPQIMFNINNAWFFSLQWNQPVYKNVNGEQLTNNYSLSANISKSFDFSSSEITKELSPTDTTLSKTTLLVQGNCEMCKARIEKVTNEFKYVSESDWEPETKVLTIFYKETKPDVDAVQKALASAGHDNEKYKAKDDVYEKLPKCCLYRSK